MKAMPTAIGLFEDHLTGEATVGPWSLGSAPTGLTLHIALKASLSDVLAACDGLRSNGVTPLSFFGAETSEPSVIGWMPAVAVYFRDPDGHLLEYLAMLDEPARVERGIVPWSELGRRDREESACGASAANRRPLGAERDQEHGSEAAHRGRGIGRKLIDAAVESARAKGHRDRVRLDLGLNG
jgi:GNAT superfamily N-acetyltransferase